MATVYFEDLVEGQEFVSDEVAVDKDEMLEYAKNDPWPFHVDEEAAKASPFGGLIASGDTRSRSTIDSGTCFTTPRTQSGRSSAGLIGMSVFHDRSDPEIGCTARPLSDPRVSPANRVGECRKRRNSGESE
jgi:hypothetical protein